MTSWKKWYSRLNRLKLVCPQYSLVSQRIWVLVHSYSCLLGIPVWHEGWNICSTPRFPLETAATAVDVMGKLFSFLSVSWIARENCCGIYSDVAPAMLGSKSGLQKYVKDAAPNSKFVHCMIHRFTLTSNTLLGALYEILEAGVKCVNVVKVGDLKPNLFQQICWGMDAEDVTLLFCSKVRWLPSGNIVNWVFEHWGGLKLFLEMKGRMI